MSSAASTALCPPVNRIAQERVLCCTLPPQERGHACAALLEQGLLQLCTRQMLQHRACATEASARCLLQLLHMLQHFVSFAGRVMWDSSCSSPSSPPPCQHPPQQQPSSTPTPTCGSPTLCSSSTEVVWGAAASAGSGAEAAAAGQAVDGATVLQTAISSATHLCSSLLSTHTVPGLLSSSVGCAVAAAALDLASLALLYVSVRGAPPGRGRHSGQ